MNPLVCAMSWVNDTGSSHAGVRSGGPDLSAWWRCDSYSHSDCRQCALECSAGATASSERTAAWIAGSGKSTATERVPMRMAASVTAEATTGDRPASSQAGWMYDERVTATVSPSNAAAASVAERSFRTRGPLFRDSAPAITATAATVAPQVRNTLAVAGAPVCE